jgi:beta-lactamase superfamily II metal-dependent hydrolase
LRKVLLYALSGHGKALVILKYLCGQKGYGTLVVKKALLIFYIVFTIWAVNNYVMQFASGNAIKVDFIDVGQADSALVTTAGGRTFLIDTGENDGGISRNSSVMRFLADRRVRRIDIIAISHYHSDHYGGILDIGSYYDVGLLMLPEPMSGSERDSHDRILEYMGDSVRVVYVNAGDMLKIGDDMVAEVVFWDRYGNTENDRSVVKVVTCFDNRFLFTGDMGIREEEMMLAKQIDLDADVVKVAHHGSRFSSDLAFYQAISPMYAVISVGRNGHGHPTEEAMENIMESGAGILRTDIEGTISFVADRAGFRRARGW